MRRILVCRVQFIENASGVDLFVEMDVKRDNFDEADF